MENRKYVELQQPGKTGKDTYPASDEQSSDLAGYSPLPISDDDTQPKSSTINTNTNANIDETHNAKDLSGAEVCAGLTILFLIFAAGVAIGMYYGADDDARLLEFSLKTLSFCPINLSPSQITAEWNVSFSTENPSDDAAIFYNPVVASVLYRGTTLSSAYMDPLYQHPKEVTMMHGNLTASSLHVDPQIGMAILVDWTIHGALEFDFEIQALVEVNPGTSAKERKDNWLRVFCGNVIVNASSSTTTSDPMLPISGSQSNNCEVYFQLEEGGVMNR